MKVPDYAMRFVLRCEGGYVNNPNDPGGATNKGVTQKVYNSWRERQGFPSRNVRQLTDDEAQSIYYDNYWRPAHCDLLPHQLALVHFDTAVNMGIGRAIRLLQAALGCVADGDFGPKTRQAITACDPGAIVKRYIRERSDCYQSLIGANPKLAVFRKGWNNRLSALTREVEAEPVANA